MKHVHQLTALLLAAVMVLSLAGCAGGAAASARPESQPVLQHPAVKPTVPAPTVPQITVPEIPVVPTDPVETFPVEINRDALEEIVTLISPDTDMELEDLTDAELTDWIESELDPGPQFPEGTPEEPVDSPAVNSQENPGDYDEQGAMTTPFDQIYPDLVQSQQVSYGDQPLLLKLPLSMGGEITEEMAAAGVGELELLFEVAPAGW